MIDAFRTLRETFRHLGRYRQAVIMLVAFLIYNDGIGTIIRMATIYGTELGIGRGALIASIMIVQFVGIPFAFLFGAFARLDRQQAGDDGADSWSTESSASSVTSCGPEPISSFWR